jgi:xanthine dehydrogenase/oxidase
VGGSHKGIELYIYLPVPLFQRVTAEVLGIKSNRVVCRVKRMGGGFGGKESRMLVLSVPVAVAAYK